MANLSGNAPKDTYQSLLKLESNGMPAGSTLKTVEAGNGDATALQLSDDDAKVNGTLTVTGATDFDSTLNVDDTVTLNSVPTDNAELTGLLIDATGQVVSRELHPNAFDGQDATNSFSTITATGQADVTSTAPNQTLNLSAGNGINFVTNNSTKTITIDTVGLFQNPMIIAKINGDYSISDTTPSRINLAPINNTSNTASIGIKQGSEFTIDTTNNEIVAVTAGIFKIDVCLFLSITTNHLFSEIQVGLETEDSSSQIADVIEIEERFDNLPNATRIKPIMFSATRYFSTAGTKIYIKVQEVSGNSHTTDVLLDQSTIKVEKLAS